MLLLLSLLAVQMPPHQSLIMQLADKGVSVEYDNKGRIIELVFGKGTDERDLMLAAQCRNVPMIICRIEVTDDGVRSIAKMRHLKSLDLNSERISAEGLETLSALPRLYKLRLTKYKPEFASVIGKLVQLRDLTLSQSGIESTNGMESLKNLERIDLSYCPLGDDDVRVFAKLAKLRSVDLTGHRVTDDGVALLATFPRLSDVYLAETPITDRCIPLLAQLRNLNSLILSDTKVKGHEIRRLSATPIRSLTLDETDM